MPGNPVANPWAREMAKNERQQKLQHNLTDLFQIAAGAVQVHQQTDQ